MKGKIKKNTSKLWDDIWKNKIPEEQDKYNLEKEKHSIRWKRIKEKVIKKFGSFEGLKIIEIGAGQGLYSLLFALEGANVTILDYSQKAINSSKLFFKRYNIKANFIKSDAFNLNKKLLSKFDVSISVGTAEHFIGEDRIKFIKIHLDVLKDKGITFIAVPNKWNPLYSLWKFLSQSFGRWKFGEEYPFSVLEFRNIGVVLKTRFSFIAGYLFDSPFQFLNRVKKLFRIPENYSRKRISYQIGTPFDKYFSSTLVAIGEK